MDSRLTINSLNSGSRKLLVLTILSVLAAWLALPPVYLNWPSFCNWIGFCKPAANQSTEKRVPSQPDSAAVALPAPRAEKPKPFLTVESLPYVGGIWRSGAGHVYIFVQTGATFEIYQEAPNGHQVKIGSGMITQKGISATIKTLRERRLAELSLEFSDDQNSLNGSFSGIHPSEKDFDLTLTREVHGSRLTSMYYIPKSKRQFGNKAWGAHRSHNRTARSVFDPCRIKLQKTALRNATLIDSRATAFLVTQECKSFGMVALPIAVVSVID